MYKIKPQWRGWATFRPKNCSEGTTIRVHMDPGDRVTTLSFFMFCAAQLKDLVDNKYKIWYNKMGIIFFYYFGNLANHITSAFAMKKSPLACPGRPRALNGSFRKFMAILLSHFCYQKLRAGCLALLQAATTLGGPPNRGTFLKTHLKNRSKNSF